MADAREISLSTDEYCRIELLPKSEWQECEGEMRAIEDYLAKHRAEAGWTDAFNLVKSSGEGLESLGLGVDELAELVALPPFSSVVTLEGGPWPHTRAWGPDKHCALFADLEGARVQHIWLRLQLRGPKQVAQIEAALDRIGSRWSLLLADWRWCCVVDLQQASRVREYLEMRRGG